MIKIYERQFENLFQNSKNILNDLFDDQNRYVIFPVLGEMYAFEKKTFPWEQKIY